MNKIFIRNGVLDEIKCNDYEVYNNQILFKNSGTYYIEYIGSGDANLTILIDGLIDVLLVVTSFGNNVNNNIKYLIKDGKLVINKFYCNKNVCEEINASLMNERSEFEYYFSSISLLEEEYIFNINHSNKKTISKICNKSVALNNSKVSFIINSNVGKGMNESILEQVSRVITFGECDIKIVPNMFIDLEDVVAKHGSVIGTIKDDLIFYLMSRGIEYNEALKLIIKGYLFSNGNYDYDLRSKILKMIDMYWG